MSEVLTWGFLNLNKPYGYTSHDCVARVRRLLRSKRVGHGGTLDPAAVGVLPLAVGQATRLLQFLRPDKVYQGTIRFGVRTETDDLTGAVIQSQPAPDLSLEKIQVALAQFQGQIEQVPPMYSAIQVRGKRLYQMAREGESVEVPARRVEVYEIRVLSWRPGSFPEVDVAIACGSGTYIRAIARDLGVAVDTGATLAQLTRTASSGMLLEESLTLEDVEVGQEEGELRLMAPDQSLAHLPVLQLSTVEGRRWSQGQGVSIAPQESGTGIVRVWGEGGGLLGIGEVQRMDLEWRLIPKVVLSQ